MAVLGNRSFKNLASLAIASLGVLFLAQVTSEGSLTGVLLALAAGAFGRFILFWGVGLPDLERISMDWGSVCSSAVW